MSFPMRSVLGLSAAALIACAAPGLANAAVSRTATLALLLRPAQVYDRPDVHAVRSHRVVSALRPYTRTRTVLPVLARRRGPNGARWLYVLLPGRPNGHAGWIAARDAKLTWTPWQLVVNTRARKLVVYRLGRLVAAFPAVVGRAETPTPRGRFFVEEALALRPGTPGAPYAFALSARSNVYQEFEGGPGQIAIHSTYGIGGTLGTAVSHGCVRLSTSALRWIAARFGAGVPVTVT